MNIVSYFNPETLDRDNDGELGLLTETITSGLQFYPIESQEFCVYINGLHGIKSFSLHVDNGTCTFSKEFRKSGDRIKPYWYASKRVNGKLKRLYFGTDFTKDKLNQIVDKLQNPPDRVENIELPKGIEENIRNCTLAGNGKNANQLQPDLISCHEQLAIAQNEIAILNKMLKEAHDDVATANRKEHEQYVQVGQLKGKLAKTEKILKERETELLKTHQKLLERGNHDDVIKSLEKELALRQTEVTTFRDEATKYHNELQQLQWEASKREDDVAGYAFMYEEHSNKIFEYYSIIEKYKQLASGKTKKENPRYAYLIDFLAEIDKLS
jgi:uncharacterized coiled-coil DUF342 family protein